MKSESIQNDVKPSIEFLGENFTIKATRIFKVTPFYDTWEMLIQLWLLRIQGGNSTKKIEKTRQKYIYRVSGKQFLKTPFRYPFVIQIIM